ncbi:MAG TPA: hypothetical protein VKY66_06255 [Protaetiibacter sp.]|nr:hypothetical protein [Protaetiibacter sp.]
MDSDAQSRPVLSPADRVAMGVIAGLAGIMGLLAVADGVWRTIALAVGNGPVELLAFAPLPGNVGDITTATVVSGALADGPRTLLVVASIISLVVVIATSGTVVLFLASVARGTPFARILFPALLTTGALMAIGGLLAAGLDGLGRMMAGGDLGEPYQLAFELPVGPWAFGFVVLAAASVVRVGSRLQRDVEGLV